MLTMIEDWVGVDNAPYVIWAGLALAALLFALLIYLIARRAFSGTYVAGGRNRRPRLAVLDATAIDSRRRLVLVRRDEVEHLILIGGPTDVVVEGGIRPGGMPAARPAGAPVQQVQAAAQQRRPAPPTVAATPQRPAPAPAPAALKPTPPAVRYPQPPAPRPVEPRRVEPVSAPVQAKPVAPPPPTAPEPVRETLPIVESAPEAKPAASPFRRFFGAKTPPSAHAETDLIVETKAPATEVDRSLEDEMSRLLDEMADAKR